MGSEMFLIKLFGGLICLIVIGGGIKLYKEIGKIEATMAAGACSQAEPEDYEEILQ